MTGIGAAFGYISQGVQDYNDRLESKRAKNLEFMRTVLKDNPNMNKQEFLKLRDSLVGNSQFLSTAMPDQLMESYADQAAKARADEDLKREMTGIEANRKRDEYYMTIAPDVIGGELPDSEAMTKLRESLPESARPDFDQRFAPRFSGARKNWATKQAEDAIVKMNTMGFDWGNEAGIQDVLKGLPVAARPYAEGLINERKAAHARKREDEDRRWNQEADVRREGWAHEAEVWRKQQDELIRKQQETWAREDQRRKEDLERQDRERAEANQKSLTNTLYEMSKPIAGDLTLDEDQRRQQIGSLVDTYTKGIPGVTIDPNSIYELHRTEATRAARAAQEKLNTSLSAMTLQTLDSTKEQNIKVFSSKGNVEALQKDVGNIDSALKVPAAAAHGALLGEISPALMPQLNAMVTEAVKKGAKTAPDIIAAVKARPDYQSYQTARSILSTRTSAANPLTTKPTVDAVTTEVPVFSQVISELAQHATQPGADPKQITKAKDIVLLDIKQRRLSLENLKTSNERGYTSVTSFAELEAQIAELNRLETEVNAIPIPAEPPKSAAKPPATTAAPPAKDDPNDPNKPVVLPKIPIEQNSEILREAEIALAAIRRNPAQRDKILRQVSRTTTIPVAELEAAISLIEPALPPG